VGRETALLAADRGAHVVVADKDVAAAQAVAAEVQKIGGKEAAIAVAIDIRKRESILQALRETASTYGGLDIIVNTAAVFPSSPDGQITDAQWGLTLDINVTANHRLVEGASKIFREQDLAATVVLVSSANAVVPKRGSEAYDVSKAAVNHLVREFAISLAPKVRVNGISPATVVKGSTMFPRDRVIASLGKYSIPFGQAASDEDLRSLLADFYAERTLTHQPIDPKDCAAAILFLAGPSPVVQPVIYSRWMEAWWRHFFDRLRSSRSQLNCSRVGKRQWSQRKTGRLLSRSIWARRAAV